jgi:hypothetical protein
MYQTTDEQTSRRRGLKRPTCGFVSTRPIVSFPSLVITSSPVLVHRTARRPSLRSGQGTSLGPDDTRASGWNEINEIQWSPQCPGGQGRGRGRVGVQPPGAALLPAEAGTVSPHVFVFQIV